MPTHDVELRDEHENDQDRAKPRAVDTAEGLYEDRQHYPKAQPKNNKPLTLNGSSSSECPCAFHAARKRM